MTTNSLMLIDGEHIAAALQQAGEKLGSEGAEVVLDFSRVSRVDSGALKAIEQFATEAAQKGVNISLLGVNVDVYKVLTLMKLTQQFTFLN